jgi:hypothetical protein
MTQQIGDSRRPRPAVYYCAREIHFVILRALSGVRNRCAMLARCAAERAALAVELATAEDSPERNLARALTAIRTSMFHCDTLCELEIIDRQVHDHLRRSVDQIIVGLEQLRTTPPDRWLGLDLVPLETEPTESRETAQPTRLETILERVARVARSVFQSPTRPPGNGQSSRGQSDPRRKSPPR